MTRDLTLREVREEDLDTLFEFEREPDAVHMAAFTPKDPNDRDAFDAHWRRILASDSVMARAIVSDGEVVGSISSYVESDRPEVCFWVGQRFWGRGIATAALTSFLSDIDTRRPMRARAAKDNAASARVLAKCGFQATGEARGFANARGEEIDELEFELRRTGPAGEGGGRT